MKTQISRNSYQKNKCYSGVYQQQGRMLTDADWNEMVDLLKGLLADALVDVVGNGSPRAGAVKIDDDLTIIPGDLYVDGIHATLPGGANLGIDKQPDLPGYIALPPTGPYEIYADVWERPVTCLEDRELRDAGLHGADTCTRTRTMLQVKWRPQPLVRGTLPFKGNGLLSLDVHTNLETSDPCDPCAGMVSADKGRVGNYLFRVEVHKVEGSANNPDTITLKWSSENGAEQFEAMSGDKMPPGFVSDKYVYEFFDLTTEKHLGVHLAKGFTPATGILKNTYEIPEGQSGPKQFVRRWDGYCVLQQTNGNWSLKEGRDKGAELSKTVSPTAHGHVSLKNDFIANLEALKLTLTLQIPSPTPTVTSERTFVAGDYWPAPVRETIYSPGKNIVSKIEPQGIVHHYLRLAQVKNGTVKQFQDDADRRRHTFPPLTDIHAVDVGYEAQCDSGLFDATHDNVKKALDRLCQIQAEHIGFAKPCDTSLYQGQSVATVQDALALLCNIKAQQVSFDTNSNCSSLPNYSDIKTVQDAIDALCLRPSGGGGCRVTVGKDGQFPTLDMALNTLLEEGCLDICLCLLPGDHDISDGLLIQNPELRINISGCGSDTTRISLKNALKAQVDSFSLSNVAMEMQNPEAVVSLTDCREITLQSCLFSGFPQESALVNLDAHDRIHLTDNQFEAYNSDAIEIPRRNFGEVEGVENLGDLFSIVDRHKFIAQTEKIAGELAALNIEARKKLYDNFSDIIIWNVANEGLSQRDLATYEMFARALNQNTINPKSLSSILRKIRRAAAVVRPATALTILTAGAATILEDNDILGLFSLYGLPAREPLTNSERGDLQEILPRIEIRFFSSNTLQLRNNRLTRMVISQKIVDVLRFLVGSEEGELRGIFETLLLTDNIIQAPDNQFVARKHSLNTTRFDFGEVKDYAGYVFGENAVYLGCYAPDGSYLLNLTQHATEAATLGLNIVGV